MCVCEFGCPNGITDLITQLHTGIMAQFSSVGSLSDKFPVNQRVKQDCVLAPKSFSLYLTAVLEFCPIDGSVYLTTFQPTSPPVCAKELLYADDSAPVVQAQLQPLIDGFNIAASSFAHTINRKLKSCFHPIPTSKP